MRGFTSLSVITRYITQYKVGLTALFAGGAVLCLATRCLSPLKIPRHRISGIKECCAKDSHYERWYTPAEDVTFCTRCQMLWRDSDISGRSAATYTVANGWRDDGPYLPATPLGPQQWDHNKWDRSNKMKKHWLVICLCELEHWLMDWQIVCLDQCRTTCDWPKIVRIMF